MSDPEVLSDAPRVLLGPGVLDRLREETERLGVSRALVFGTPRRRAEAERVRALLGDQGVGMFLDAREHVPRAVVDAACQRADALAADVLVALGGGTAIGAAKAVAALRDLPIVAIPTTYSGSEMTDIYGITEGGVKTTARHPRVQPTLVLYDPELSRMLPVRVSVVSGFNAVAHCVEALWVAPGTCEARDAGAFGLRTLEKALRRIVSSPRDAHARREALRGAYHAGVALSGGIALHHKLCHMLGGTFGLPHAETHTVLLPQVTRYNREAAPDAMRGIADAIGAGSAATGLFDLARQLGAPTALAPFGFSEAAARRAAELATEVDASANPRGAEADALLDLFERARLGVRPEPEPGI